MALPTANDVYDELEGYGINNGVVTAAWIERKRDKFIIPYAERFMRSKLYSTVEVEEMYSGNGDKLLILNRRNIVELVSVKIVVANLDYDLINIRNIKVIAEEGILRARIDWDNPSATTVFPKGKDNLIVTYKYGMQTPPAEVEEAIKFLMCEKALGQLANRTGGGDLSVKDFARQYGGRSKFTHIRNEYTRDAMAILRRYTTSVVGA